MKRWLLITGLTLTTGAGAFIWFVFSLRIAELEVKLSRSLKSGDNDYKTQFERVSLLYHPFAIYRDEKVADVVREHSELVADRKREREYVREF